MIGWVPHVLVGFLDEAGGPDARRVILADVGLDPEAAHFALNTDVPDPACRRIIETACAHLGVTEAQAFALFAPYFLARARVAFPGFFRGVDGARAFLLRQPAIHNSIATGLSDPRQRRAVSDKFRVEAVPRGVRVHYNSPNRLAGLYAAVARELATGFGETAEVSFEVGGPEDASCTMRVELSPALAAARGEAAGVGAASMIA